MFKSLRTYHAESIAYRSCNKFYQTVVHYKQHVYNVLKKLNDPRNAKMGLGLNLVRSACTNNCAERTRICLERFTFVNLGPIFYNAFVCYESLTKLSVCSNRWLYTDWYTGRNVLYTLGKEKPHFGLSGTIVTSQAASNCTRSSAFGFDQYTIWGCLAGQDYIECNYYAVIT